MNDALMIGVVLTLVFSAIIFYVYNRMSMTEKKMHLFEGVLTDLKVMMDAAPFVTGPPPSHMGDFEPTPEYLNAISGPEPIQKDEIDEVSSDAEEYQQTLEQALETATEWESRTRTLHIDDIQTQPSVTGQPAINVTKLSPDLESMTVKELQALAKEKSMPIPAGTRRKELIELLRRGGPAATLASVARETAMLDGPTPSVEGATLDLDSNVNVSEMEVTV